MSDPTRPAGTAASEEQPHLATVAGLQRDYDVARQLWERAKDEAAAFKKIAEAKARKLDDFIRGLNAPTPLFEVWRQTPITEVGLPDGVVMLLQEAGYDTVGKLADYTEKGGKLTDIPHIGEAKAEAIVKAMERFWSDKKAEGEV